VQASLSFLCTGWGILCPTQPPYLFFFLLARADEVIE